VITSRSRARSWPRPTRFDAEEDERFGEARGDELPAELQTAQGRRGWLREAKRGLDERRADEARPIPRSRPDRLKESKRRLEEEHRVECGGLYSFMRRVLATEHGGALYTKRQVMVEPVFADTKFNRRIDRFLRRRRAAARSEWRLTNAAHNLLKLWRHTSAIAA
jgi:Transposase DDE domain